MRIKEVEELVGITKKNIRFYEKEGLLTPGRELENSYRDYTDEDVKRLRVIKLLRKLDMPISAISDVLENRQSLPEALHLHSLLLEEQRCGIVNAQRVCRLISESGEDLAQLDTEHYLSEILRGEENSTELVDIHRRDTVKKYRESVIVSIVIVALLLVLAVFLINLKNAGSMSTGVLLACSAIIAIVLVGVIAAIFARLKEIKGGEENDLGNY